MGQSLREMGGDKGGALTPNARLHGGRQLGQQATVVPTKAGIGDALAVLQLCGSSVPGGTLRPGIAGWPSIMTQNTRGAAAICAAMSCATSLALMLRLLLLAWLQSTISVAGRPAAARSLQAVATLAAS